MPRLSSRQDGEPYSTTWIFGKPLIARLPDLPERYESACTAIRQVRDRLALLRMLENTRAALTVADWLIARYEQLKTGRGFLDFNDLITRTVRLLARQDAGPWILYKLDKGIDHILIDEAQDTSPDQWGVVGRLTEEFFAGAGARDHVRRTVFAVGDEKQSIYSFQGAAPESFAASGFAFSEKVRGAEGRFEHVKLTLSFRSTEDVLAAVDRVFARDAARRGLTFAGDPIEHNAIRSGAPGYVEVWPSLGADAVQEPDDWTMAIDHATAPAVRLAENIARTIAHWLNSGEIIEGSGKRLTPGDVLVLVQEARQLRQCLGQEPQGKAHSGGRRRPAQPARAYRGSGHDRARPLRPSAGRRPVACRAAEKSGLRLQRGQAVRTRRRPPESHLAWRGSCAAAPRPIAIAPKRRERWRNGRRRRRSGGRSSSIRAFSAGTAFAPG